MLTSVRGILIRAAPMLSVRTPSAHLLANVQRVFTALAPFALKQMSRQRALTALELSNAAVMRVTPATACRARTLTNALTHWQTHAYSILLVQIQKGVIHAGVCRPM